jgi:hypothetical protein
MSPCDQIIFGFNVFKIFFGRFDDVWNMTFAGMRQEI